MRATCPAHLRNTQNNSDSAKAQYRHAEIKRYVTVSVEQMTGKQTNKQTNRQTDKLATVQMFSNRQFVCLQLRHNNQMINVYCWTQIFTNQLKRSHVFRLQQINICSCLCSRFSVPVCAGVPLFLSVLTFLFCICA